MNKRAAVIILGSALLIVVVGIAGYFFFSSPSGQAWERDWIGSPIGLTAIATVGAAVGTVSAVIVALLGIQIGIVNERRRSQEEYQAAQRRFEVEREQAREALEDERRRFQEAQEEGRSQFLASQKQTQDALEEGRRQFLEAQYAAHRPLLVPAGRHLDDIPAVIEWNASVEFINIQNAGTGVANNIWGYSCRLYLGRRLCLLRSISTWQLLSHQGQKVVRNVQTRYSNGEELFLIPTISSVNIRWVFPKSALSMRTLTILRKGTGV